MVDECFGIHSDSFLVGKKITKILFLVWYVVMDIKYLYIVLSLKEILEYHRQKTIFHYSTVRDKKGTGYNT